MRLQSITIHATVLSAMLATFTPTTARAFVITDSPNLPPLAGEYVSPQEFHALYAAGLIQLTNVHHLAFTATFPPPPLGTTNIHGFGSTVNMMLSTDSGNNFFPQSAPGNVMVQVFHDSDLGNTSFFDTEMLQLDLSGGTLPAGVMIRESPTLPSLGQTSITDLGGGQYRIDSFFDVFTELSFDGGQSWIPQDNGPTRMTLVPEPTSALLVLAGAGVCGLRRSRRKPAPSTTAG